MDSKQCRILLVRLIATNIRGSFIRPYLLHFQVFCWLPKIRHFEEQWPRPAPSAWTWTQGARETLNEMCATRSRGPKILLKHYNVKRGDHWYSGNKTISRIRSEKSRRIFPTKGGQSATLPGSQKARFILRPTSMLPSSTVNSSSGLAGGASPPDAASAAAAAADFKTASIDESTCERIVF